MFNDKKTPFSYQKEPVTELINAKKRPPDSRLFWAHFVSLSSSIALAFNDRGLTDNCKELNTSSIQTNSRNNYRSF